MNFTQQIIESFSASSVERILVIDDAYDPPEFSPEISGDLLEILSSGDLREHVGRDELCEEVRKAAISALSAHEFDDSAIPTATAALYSVFVDGREGSIDPGGTFAAAKASALEAIDPLLELLRQCGSDPAIVTVGMEGADKASEDLRPDLIFMDYFLSPADRTTSAATELQLAEDTTRSVGLLRSILDALAESVPAVVLMSSKEVVDQRDVYLSRLDDRVMALRFGFLLKGWVQGRGQHVTASGDAADVLLDTSGSFDFGRSLETALKAWRAGVDKALEQIDSELREFDVRDFADLLRFRLYDEGEPFSDYLEWFLGESLRAMVDGEVAWTTEEFSRLNDKKLTQGIEGAHPVPSTRLATFFHRIRFNSRKTRPRWRFALGDMFLSSDGKDVRMVVSPDCDLVARRGKHAAKRILTIGGSIRELSDGQALAGELIFHNSTKAIKWNYKDLMAHGFGKKSELDVDGCPYRYFASMRPMPAQAIQKAVLADLSRVGLSVPPSVGVGAPVSVYLRKMVGNQARVEDLGEFRKPQAQVIMPRGGNERRSLVLFTPSFFRELLARLEGLTEDELSCDDRGSLRECLGDKERLREAMLRDGLKLPGEGVFKVAMSIGTPKKKSWLEIVVNLSEDARIHLYGTDPLEQ